MNTATTHPEPIARSAFQYFDEITLRYADNDMNGHVNNAHYYSFFDTAIESYLRDNGLRTMLAGNISTPVVASSCRYFEEIAYPGTITLGVRVNRIGHTSITYEIGIFVDDATRSCAAGVFTTVATDRRTKRPVAVPDAFREAHADR